MSKKNKKENRISKESKYGEMVPSNFGWISPELQKKRANYLNEISNKKSDSKN